MGGKLRLRLCKRIAHVRGGCTPGNSRLWVLVPSGDRPGPTEPAGETLAAARAHRATSARARPSAWAVNSRGLHPGQFAPGGGELRSRLYEPLAHVRGGCTPGNSRLGAVSCAHACTNRWRTSAGVAPQAIRAWGRWAALTPVRTAGARARRGYLPGGAAGGKKAKREKAVANATGLLSL